MKKLMILAGLSLLTLPGSSLAQDQTVVIQQLMQKITQLERRVQDLESKLGGSGSGGGIPTTTPGGGGMGQRQPTSIEEALTPEQKAEYDKNMKMIKDYVEQQKNMLKDLDEEEKRNFGPR